MLRYSCSFWVTFSRCMRSLYDNVHILGYGPVREVRAHVFARYSKVKDGNNTVIQMDPMSLKVAGLQIMANLAEKKWNEKGKQKYK